MCPVDVATIVFLHQNFGISSALSFFFGSVKTTSKPLLPGDGDTFEQKMQASSQATAFLAAFSSSCSDLGATEHGNASLMM